MEAEAKAEREAWEIALALLDWACFHSESPALLWVAVKDLNLSSHTSKTILLKPYYLLYIPIMVTSIKFFNSNPVRIGTGGLLWAVASKAMNRL